MGQTIRDPKQQRAIEKRESLINTAFELFVEKGFYNTNSKEISKKAGVSTGLFYNYFNDKSDIFLEVFNRISEKKYLKVKEVLNELSKKNDTKQVLKEYLVKNIEILYKLAFIYKDMEMIKKEYKEVGEARKKYQKQTRDLVIDFLKKINDSENIKNLDIKCEVIITTIDANCILVSKLENKNDQEKFIDEIVTLVCNYMF